MISTVLALIAVTGPVQEPIDFQLGWKQGDKFAYTFNTEGGGMSDKGTFEIAVTKADAKGFTISLMVDMISRKGPGASTVQLDKRGRVTSKGTTLDASSFIVQMTLPDKPIALGGSFRFNATAMGSKMELTGKLAKIDETKGRVAHFSYEGTLRNPQGQVFKVKMSSVFDMARGLFTSSAFEIVDFGVSYSLKLIEKGKGG